MHRFANPARFLKIARPATAWLLVIGLVLAGAGLVGGLTLTPPDYLQGETVRIMYVHVPSAWLGMAGWAGIAAASIAQLVWRHPLAAVAGRATCSGGRDLRRHLPADRLDLGPPDLGHLVGMGRPADFDADPVLPLPRLHRACGARRGSAAARGGSRHLFGLVGAINLPIIHYSVLWWRTLHQGQSIGAHGLEHRQFDPVAASAGGARLHLPVRRRGADAHAGGAGRDEGRGAHAPGGAPNEPLVVRHRGLCGRSHRRPLACLPGPIVDHAQGGSGGRRAEAPK